MQQKSNKKAFTLIELSISVFIIAALMAVIISGSSILNKSTIKTAQALTKSAPIYAIPDLVLWLETSLDDSIGSSATSAGNLSNADPVYYWQDISANKIKLSQPTSSSQPNYLLKGINNLPAINFDGSNDTLFSTSAPISKGSAKYTMIAVFSALSVGYDYAIFDQGSASLTASNYGSIYMNNSKKIKMDVSGSYYDFSSSPIISINSPNIAIIVVDNTKPNISLYQNSNTGISSSSSPSGLNIVNEVVSIGSRQANANNFFNGLISEIIVFDRKLNLQEIASINKYLSRKYNITISS